jgi:NADH:ubiquinone oxidoreductase subunit 6 (subunit J)
MVVRKPHHISFSFVSVTANTLKSATHLNAAVFAFAGVVYLLKASTYPNTASSLVGVNDSN